VFSSSLGEDDTCPCAPSTIHERASTRESATAVPSSLRVVEAEPTPGALAPCVGTPGAIPFLGYLSGAPIGQTREGALGRQASHGGWHRNAIRITCNMHVAIIFAHGALRGKDGKGRLPEVRWQSGQSLKIRTARHTAVWHKGRPSRKCPKTSAWDMHTQGEADEYGTRRSRKRENPGGAHSWGHHYGVS
jgi:hypothetical protein